MLLGPLVHFESLLRLEISGATDAVVLPWPWLGLIDLHDSILLGILEIVMNLIMISKVVLGLQCAVNPFVPALHALSSLTASHLFTILLTAIIIINKPTPWILSMIAHNHYTYEDLTREEIISIPPSPSIHSTPSLSSQNTWRSPSPSPLFSTDPVPHWYPSTWPHRPDPACSPGSARAPLLKFISMLSPLLPLGPYWAPLQPWRTWPCRGCRWHREWHLYSGSTFPNIAYDSYVDT